MPNPTPPLPPGHPVTLDEIARDRVRSFAASRHVGHDAGCDCIECDTDRAVLAYVPPSNPQAPALMSVQVDAYGMVRVSNHRGVVISFDHEDARRLAHCLNAAADRVLPAADTARSDR